MDVIRKAINKYISRAGRILSWDTVYSPGAMVIGRGDMKLSPVDRYTVSPRAIGLFDLIIATSEEQVMSARNLLSEQGVVLSTVDSDMYINRREIIPGLYELSNPRPEKIFVIGLTHTGKNSVDMALEKFGMTYKHYPEPKRVIEEVENYDVITDTPVIQFIEIMDRLYPTAKFILTVRDIESWLQSCYVHWANKRPTERQLWNRHSVYGIYKYNERIFRSIHKRHNRFVKEYFKERPRKLLVLNVCAGEGYEKLCPFLGLPILDETFPHKNRR